MRTPNTVLRAWRERIVNRTQSDVAADLGTSSSTLHGYENGRSIPTRALERLEACYDTSGMLTQLVRAAATPEAFSARADWEHNYLGRSRPVWAWIRPSEPDRPLRVACHWGAFQVKEEWTVKDEGLFLTSPVSMQLPAVFFRLAPDGWVSFGSGTPPKDLGVPVVSAMRLLHRFENRDHVTGVLGKRLQRFALAQPQSEPPPTIDVPSGVIEEFLNADAAQTGQTVAGRQTGTTAGVYGTAIRRARLARRLSQGDLAHACEKTLGRPVDQRQISRVENDRRTSIPELNSAIDTCLGADGRLCCDDASILPGGDIRFAAGYGGPVWVELESPSPFAAEFTWNGWVKPLRFETSAGRPRGVVRLRKLPADGPLTVQILSKTGNVARAGTGWSPIADNVNDNWHVAPTDEMALWQRSLNLVEKALGITRDDIRRLVANARQDNTDTSN